MSIDEGIHRCRGRSLNKRMQFCKGKGGGKRREGEGRREGGNKGTDTYKTRETYDSYLSHWSHGSLRPLEQSGYDEGVDQGYAAQ